MVDRGFVIQNIVKIGWIENKSDGIQWDSRKVIWLTNCFLSKMLTFICQVPCLGLVQHTPDLYLYKATNEWVKYVAESSQQLESFI